MKIWIFNNYNTLPEHGAMTRHYNFAKFLKKAGHEPVVFVGSHPHNSDVQLIEGPEKFWVYQTEPFPWVLVKTCKYGNNRKKQVLSMFQYCWNACKAAKQFEKPDVILGSSAHPLAAALAVHLGRKYHCRSVVEVRDLWPESIVVYGIAGPHNPAVIALRWLEKWFYKNTDAVIFTMEGGYDYIVERGWDKEIPRSKVFHVNNGVDLPQFDENRENFPVEDADLENPDTIKVVYTGSIRKANHMGILVDVAKATTDPRIKYLVWGAGDELEDLRERVRNEQVQNIVFKGSVEKKYIPSILCQADINLVHWEMSKLLNYGVSYNKLFEYLAAGKPVFSTIRTPYSIIGPNHCGISTEGFSPEEIAGGIQRMAALPEEELRKMGENARKTAHEYDFENLTRKLIRVFEGDNKT